MQPRCHPLQRFQQQHQCHCNSGACRNHPTSHNNHPTLRYGHCSTQNTVWCQQPQPRLNRHVCPRGSAKCAVSMYNKMFRLFRRQDMPLNTSSIWHVCSTSSAQPCSRTRLPRPAFHQRKNLVSSQLHGTSSTRRQMSATGTAPLSHSPVQKRTRKLQPQMTQTTRRPRPRSRQTYNSCDANTTQRHPDADTTQHHPLSQLHASGPPGLTISDLSAKTVQTHACAFTATSVLSLHNTF